MPIDHRRINAFIDKSANRQFIADVVRHAGFTISWTISYRNELWGFYLKPNKNLQDLLATSREVLLWTSEFPDWQVLALTQSIEIINRNQPRLCEDLAVIVSENRNIGNLVDEAVSGKQTHFVGFSIEDFDSFAPRGNKSFVAALQEKFFTKDLYFLSTAITNRRAFFGRDSLIKELLANIRSSTTHIALFGLRKTGKTSILFRLIDLLSSFENYIYIHLDIQTIDSIRPTAEYFLWSIGEQLYNSHASVRAVQGRRLFGQYPLFVEIPDKDVVFDYFDHDLRLLLKKTDKRFVFMFDEIELMSPDTPGSNWEDSYVRCWRLLRGLDQTNPKRLQFLIAGTNPRCVETNQLGGKENPTYNFFSKIYLKPLTESESKELLVTLGQRMGLIWDKRALKHLHNIIGGHPFLLRASASIIHKALLPRESQVVVTESTVTETVPIFLIELNSNLSQMIEVLADYFSNEYFLLETLAAGHIAEFREMAETFPDDVAHLVGYGLVKHDFSSSGLSVELLQTWLQQRTKKKRAIPRDHTKNALKEGASIDGYTILSSIGHCGGFGRVYRAKSYVLGDKKVALKVLNEGSLVKLQREVDVLLAINHPSIVRVLDHGRLSSGELYLAMEFIDGPSLKAFCQRANRLRTNSAKEFLIHLLDALSTLHPNENKLEELRKKEKLSIEEFRDLEVYKHGFIHRDIKPENIVVRDHKQPVLIDFGISVRVAQPIRTCSATPGYLPPDGIIGVWTPDIDLYQLGLTMLQVIAGIEFDGENVEDLKNILKEEIDDPLKSVVLGLSEKSKINRYKTAQDALKVLKKK